MALKFMVRGKPSSPPVDWGDFEKTKAGLQRGRVHRAMSDGQWHTLAKISEITKDPEASVSARLRDLRKKKFGGFIVDRQRLDSGLYRYRIKS